MLDEKPQENTSKPSEKSQEDVNNLTNASTINPETDQNMELYHPHPKHHERKLKDYFYEFFMLFIAITAGFFMENLREEYVENHKEGQYIESLIGDIQQDTSDLVKMVELNKKQIKGIDSLLKLLESPAAEMDIKRMYYLANRYLGNLNGFSSSEITINQLRSTGSLRLIDDRAVSDSMVLYYSTYDSHIDQQKYVIQTMQNILEMNIKTMDYSAFSVNTRPMTFDKSYAREFYNRVIIFKSLLEYEVVWMENFHKQGISLLKYLKEEYKLE